MKPLVTVIVLNFARSCNIPIIIDSIKSQTILAEITIWNNGRIDPNDWQSNMEIYCSQNLYCWPRWFLASQVSTEFVVCMDDDICPISPDSLEAIISIIPSRSKSPQLVGIEGVLLRPGAPYFPKYGRPWLRPGGPPDDGKSSLHLGYVNNRTSVDIVKGRFVAARTEYFSALPMRTPYQNYCDDIAISSIIGKGRPTPHILAPMNKKSFSDLPGKHSPNAISRQPFNRMLRERARKYYFSHI